MSILENQDLACPSCGETVSFEVVHSVLADRRPDLRDAILANRFQAAICEHCDARFRREPDLNYLDIGRGQWLLVRPAAEVADWPALESQALALFELGYGVLAPAAAQAIGRDLTVRVAFGWPALREKLIARDADLDDVIIEILKLNLMRTLDAPGVGDTLELRLADVDETTLGFMWIEAASEQPVEVMRVPRAAYDDLTPRPKSYDDLADLLTEGPFVDVNRLLIQPIDRETLPEAVEA